MDFLRIGFISALFFAWVSATYAWEWEPLYQNYELTYNGKTYSVVVIRPVDMWARVRAVPHEDPERRRKKLQTLFWENRYEASLLLGLAALHIRDVYWESGVFDEETNPEFIDSLETLTNGQSPMILVCEHKNPFHIHATVSIGYDFGEGIPSEARCVGRPTKGTEMKALGDPEVEVKPVPISIIHPFGKLEPDVALSTLLSKIPRVVGANNEIKTFTNPGLEEDFAPMLHRLVIAFGLDLWSGKPVPDDVIIPPVPEETKKLLAQAKALHPWLQDELLYPDQQVQVVANNLFLHTFGFERYTLFRRLYSFPKFLDRFWDPDRPHVEAFIAKQDRGEFETGKTAEKLVYRRGFKVVEGGKLNFQVGVDMMQRSRLSCGMVLGKRGDPNTLRLAPDFKIPAGSFFDLEDRD